MWQLAANDLQQTRAQLHSEREGSARWAAGSARRRFIGAYLMEGPGCRRRSCNTRGSTACAFCRHCIHGHVLTLVTSDWDEPRKDPPAAVLDERDSEPVCAVFLRVHFLC